MYWDDEHGTLTVSPDIIVGMRVAITEDVNTGVSRPFLLDDDSSILFPLDDIASSMQQPGIGLVMSILLNYCENILDFRSLLIIQSDRATRTYTFIVFICFTRFFAN